MVLAGLFAYAKGLGISAIYSGHDHDNNYEGVLEGVRLAYGHKTGGLCGGLRIPDLAPLASCDQL